MARHLTALFAAFATSALCACGGTDPVNVTMNAQNDSLQSGTATLTQKGDDVEVVVSTTGGTDTGLQPAHIHEGSCPGLGAVKYPLSNVSGGKSTTLISGVKLADLDGRRFVINVHNSAQASKYVTCGEIP